MSDQPATPHGSTSLSGDLDPQGAGLSPARAASAVVGLAVAAVIIIWGLPWIADTTWAQIGRQLRRLLEIGMAEFRLAGGGVAHQLDRSAYRFALLALLRLAGSGAVAISCGDSQAARKVPSGVTRRCGWLASPCMAKRTTMVKSRP